ncbi:MAG: DUF523 domain-containing protein [Rhodobacteraceae bacterium]|jgi:uncharacterized protein YbbK (DUF523 family)|nr:DUF523 domain-containing protein [Paracoccaceae bacterium]
MTPRILISSCLMGTPVRHDGRARTLHHILLQDWQRRALLVPLCPEGLGGLPTPRAPAEIEPGATADDVLGGAARILAADGTDLTAPFLVGARQTLRHAQAQGCRFALLTDGSPSCGVTVVYGGMHDGQRRAGAGVTAALLARNGITVFAPQQIDQLADALPD